MVVIVIKLSWSLLALVSGLTLEKSSGDFVNGKVVGVSPDLYMKGCIEEVSDGIKVIYTILVST